MFKNLFEILKDILKRVPFSTIITAAFIISFSYFIILLLLPQKYATIICFVSLKKSMSISFIATLSSLCIIIIMIVKHIYKKITIKHRNNVAKKHEDGDLQKIIDLIKNDDKAMNVLKTINNSEKSNWHTVKRDDFSIKIIQLCKKCSLIEPFTLEDKFNDDFNSSKYKLTNKGKEILNNYKKQ